MRNLYPFQRSKDGCRVTVRDTDERAESRVALKARLDLWGHSPTGFEWGYSGSGPAQTALALLAHETSDDQRAVDAHQRLKFDMVAGMPRGDRAFTVSWRALWDWLLRDAATELIRRSALRAGGLTYDVNVEFVDRLRAAMKKTKR